MMLYGSSSNLDKMQSTADRVRIVRKHLGISQEKLGKLAGGLTKSAVSQWEAGKTNPDWDALRALENNAGINAEWIRVGVGEMLASANRPSHGQMPRPAEASPSLTPRQQALLGYFDGLTEEQQEAVLRELSEKKQVNQAIVAHFLGRQKAS